MSQILKSYEHKHTITRTHSHTHTHNTRKPTHTHAADQFVRTCLHNIFPLHHGTVRSENTNSATRPLPWRMLVSFEVEEFENAYKRQHLLQPLPCKLLCLAHRQRTSRDQRLITFPADSISRFALRSAQKTFSCLPCQLSSEDLLVSHASMRACRATVSKMKITQVKIRRRIRRRGIRKQIDVNDNCIIICNHTRKTYIVTRCEHGCENTNTKTWHRFCNAIL